MSQSQGQSQQPQQQQQGQPRNLEVSNTSGGGNVVGGISGDGTGGILKCFIHNFETYDPNEFGDHCEQTGHTLSGSTFCSGGCKRSVDFEDVPYQKELKVMCPDCFNNMAEFHANAAKNIRLTNNEQATQQQQQSSQQGGQQ